MNIETIADRVKRIIAIQSGVSLAGIKNEMSLDEDIGNDSIDDVELVMAIEDEFSIDIPDKAAEKILTVQQAIDYVASVVIHE